MVLTRNQRMQMMTKMEKNKNEVTGRMTRMERNKTDITGIDRLSELPDALLHHIFSFIDTKHIVRACVLSKRYEFLWHSLNIFQFHQNKYRSFNFFINFIIQVLSCSERLKIKFFSLEFVFSPNLRFLRKILSYVLSREPQHLRLNIGLGDYFSRNPIISSKSLKTLHVPCGSINGSYSFNFPILTELFLEKPIFDDPHCVFSEPFFRCPNLKYLTLHNCVSKLDTFSIVGKQLEKLDISIQSYRAVFRIIIECQNLSSFKYKGESFVGISANVPSIEKVDLNCTVTRAGHWTTRVLNVIEIVQQFQHSKYLKLGLGIMNVLITSNVYEQQYPLKLSNLTFLELKLPSGYRRMADVIVYLLRHSPAAVLNGRIIWEEILDSEGMQERTYFIDEFQRLQVMTRGSRHIQLKVNYQLEKGWNYMYNKL